MRSPWPAGDRPTADAWRSNATAGSDGDTAANYSGGRPLLQRGRQYAQQSVVANETDGATSMMGYSDELRGRAIRLGARLGKSQKAVEAEFHNDDGAYLHKFYKFDTVAMRLSDFGTGEDRALGMEISGGTSELGSILPAATALPVGFLGQPRHGFLQPRRQGRRLGALFALFGQHLFRRAWRRIARWTAWRRSGRFRPAAFFRSFSSRARSLAKSMTSPSGSATVASPSTNWAEPLGMVGAASALTAAPGWRSRPCCGPAAPALSSPAPVSTSGDFGARRHIHFGAHRADALDQVDHPMHFRGGGLGVRQRAAASATPPRSAGCRAACACAVRAHSSSVMKGMKGCSSFRIWSRAQAVVARVSALAASSLPSGTSAW